MKKIISIILTVLLIMCLTACDSGNTGSTETADNSEGTPTQSQSKTDPETPPQTPAQKTVYELLDELLGQSFGEIKLSITTSTGDIELKAEYVMNESSVTYSVEQLNLLPEDGNVSNADQSYKTTLSGKAVIENGVVKTVDGDPVATPSYDELKGSFSFKASNFENVKEESGSFSADVVSPKEFMGTDKSLNDMSVAVEYTDTAVQKITVTYKTNLSSVTLKYEFKK